jgi:hypothetical protein
MPTRINKFTKDFSMPITDTIKKNFNRSFDLYQELIKSLDEEHLSTKLPNLPSNTIGGQIWCVVGARESYSKAIHADKWSGFACSLNSEQVHIKTEVLNALVRSEKAVQDVLLFIEKYSDAQNQLIVDLLEHETAHHGQLIRYLYGAKLKIPAGWKSRYALD